MMDAARTGMPARLGDAGLAAGTAAVVVATPVLGISAMVASPRYGESAFRAIGRTAGVPLAAFGAPVAAAAFAARLVDGGSVASSATGAVAGAVTGAALGATLLHGPLQVGGSPMSRMSTAAFMAIAGGVFGAFSGAVTDALTE